MQCCIQIIWCSYQENSNFVIVEVSFILGNSLKFWGNLWCSITCKLIKSAWETFGLNFQDMSNYFIFLISHCTNYIHAKFHVSRTIYYHFIKKNEKPLKGPQAKNSQWALGLNFQNMADYFIFSYFFLYKLHSFQISCS